MKASDVLSNPDYLREVMAGLRLREERCYEKARAEDERGDEEQAETWRVFARRSHRCLNALILLEHRRWRRQVG